MTTREGIVDGARFAVAFLGQAWRASWGAMAIATSVVAICLTLHLWSPGSPWRAGALALTLVAIVTIEGGLYRVALERGAPGPAGVQFGPIELRLLAVWALTLLFLLVLALLAFVVVLAFAFAVASAGHGFKVAELATWAAAVDGRGRIVVGVVAAVAAVGLIWAYLRVSLGGVASVDRGRIQVLASWPDTRGRVAAILATRICLGVLPIGLAFAALLISGPHGDGGGFTWGASLAAGAALAGLWVPLSVGLCAYFYSPDSAG